MHVAALTRESEAEHSYLQVLYSMPRGPLRIRLCSSRLKLGRYISSLTILAIVTCALLIVLPQAVFFEWHGVRDGNLNGAGMHNTITKCSPRCNIDGQQYTLHRHGPKHHHRRNRHRHQSDPDFGITGIDARLARRMRGTKQDLPASQGDKELVDVMIEHGNLQKSIRNGLLPFAAVVYECTEHTICGGLTDRLEGIIVSFVLAIVSKRSLLVHYCKPGALDRFYLPNELDWRLAGLSQFQLGKILHSPHLGVRRHEEDTPDCEVLVSKYLNTTSPVFRLTTNHAKSCVRRLLSRHAHIGNVTSQHLMARLFRHLFQPAPLLVQALKLFTRRNAWRPESSVCLHIRYGGILVDKAIVERVRYKVLDPFWHCARHVKEVMTKLNLQVSSWMVISDSDEVLLRSKQFLSSLSNSKVIGTKLVGPVLHIDKLYSRLYHNKSGDSPFQDNILSGGQCPLQRGVDGEMRVFLDHYLLSVCHVLVGSRKSGFSASASSLHPGSSSLLFMVPESDGNRTSTSGATKRDCLQFHPGSLW